MRQSRRTYVVGTPNERQRNLIDTYREMHEATRKAIKPGITVYDLDIIGKEIYTKRGLEQFHLKGISHGIGLRFEENPASTIIPAHSKTKLGENMTVTVGHTILAVPGVGGVQVRRCLSCYERWRRDSAQLSFVI